MIFNSFSHTVQRIRKQNTSTYQNKTKPPKSSCPETLTFKSPFLPTRSQTELSQEKKCTKATPSSAKNVSNSGVHCADNSNYT